MPRTVLLLHTLPDGSNHVDWLTERGPALAAFRLPRRPDEPGWETLDATRLPDHRMLYLDYEGEVYGGRGHVRRLAAGAVESWLETPDTLDALLVLGARRLSLRGVRSGPGPEAWTFTRVPD